MPPTTRGMASKTTNSSPSPAKRQEKLGDRPIMKPDSKKVQGKTDDIDARDADEVTMYQSILEHAKNKEARTSVRPIYMAKQHDINHRMRETLIDWLVEVHFKFNMDRQTLYLTVNLIDRYLELQQVTRAKLQLVGVTCLLIASKYEEIYCPPELCDLVYICDKAFSRQEIIEMEEKILKALPSDVNVPTAHIFLVHYLKAGQANKSIAQMSCMLLDGTLQVYALLDHLPSHLAAACVFIARRTAGRDGWSPTLRNCSGYTEEVIIPVARAILTAKQQTRRELKGVYKKYSSRRYTNVVADTEFPIDF